MALDLDLWNAYHRAGHLRDGHLASANVAGILHAWPSFEPIVGDSFAGRLSVAEKTLVGLHFGR